MGISWWQSLKGTVTQKGGDFGGSLDKKAHPVQDTGAGWRRAQPLSLLTRAGPSHREEAVHLGGLACPEPLKPARQKEPSQGGRQKTLGTAQAELSPLQGQHPHSGSARVMTHLVCPGQTQ